MSRPRFSVHIAVLVLALAALLIIAFTLVVVAQDPDDSDAAVPSDQVTVVEEPELPTDPSASSATTYYKFLSANTFVPNEDDMTYADYGGGCVYRTGGTHHLAYHSLELPQGAEIDNLRLYFYDTDLFYNVLARLYAYDGTGASTLIATAESSGQPGQAWVESGTFSHVVDNETEALSLRLSYTNDGESIIICGVRVQYKYTPTITDLPLILNGSPP